jgi:hypothetical protein
MTLKVSVTASALREVLVALNGPPHLIRELQVLTNPDLFPDNPITILTAEFNAFVVAQEKTDDT